MSKVYLLRLKTTKDEILPGVLGIFINEKKAQEAAERGQKRLEELGRKDISYIIEEKIIEGEYS